MTSPAICVIGQAHVAEVAALMLQHKIHRVIVVESASSSIPVGVVTRSDIFQPVLCKSSDLIANQEVRR